MARLNLTPIEKEKRRKHILNCALELMATQGYKNCTMQQIAKESNVAIGTLYLYFNNKLEIYLALFENALDMLDRYFHEASSTPATDAKTRIHHLFQAYIRFYQSHNHSYRILFSGFLKENTEAHKNEYLKQRVLNTLKHLEEPFIEGVAEGIIKPCDTFKLVVSLWAMFDGVLMLQDKTQITALGDEFQGYYTYGIEIILNGILIKDDSEAKKT